MKQQLFNIGDRGWRVYAGQTGVQVPCIVCNGKKHITFIDGFGEGVTLECDYCSSGYGPPSGFNTQYEYKAVVEPVFIENISKDSDGTFEYNYTQDIYKTKEEAELAGQKLVKKYEEEQEKKLKYKKENPNKSWGWHIGYHRNNIKEAERKIEYHSEKLGLAKSKAKEEKVK